MLDDSKDEDVRQNSGYNTRSLHQVGPKFIKHIQEDTKGFYLVACKSYDKRIRIYHSHMPNFKIKLTRSVENGNLKFFDLKTEIN